MVTKRRILAISEVNQGMQPFFYEGKYHIEGMPAYANTLFGFLKQGYEIHLICLTQRRTNPPPVDKLFVYDVQVKYSRLGTPFSCLKVIMLAIMLASKHSFDLIYGFGTYGALAGILSYILRIPNVRRIFGTFLYPELGQGTRTDKVKAFLRHTMPYCLFSLPTAGLIITNDGTHGDKAARILGQPPSKIHYLYNGVEKQIEKRLDLAKPVKLLENLKRDEQAILVYMSRLAKWKRVDRAIKAMKYIQHTPKPLLVVIGDGPAREELNALVAQEGLQEYVKFLGQLPQEDALGIVLLGDIFMSLYEHANLGNALIEAMFLGRCIISINDGSLDGLIENGVNGILVDEPSPQVIAASIDSLLRIPSICSEYGKRAKNRAMEVFDTWETRIQKEIQLIERIVGENK